MIQLAFPPFDGSAWLRVRDGDASVREVFDRHYSRRRFADGRRPKKIMGPGQYILLRTAQCDAILGWRVFRSDDPTARDHDVNCAFFRNEGPALSSDLILEAERIAETRWGPRRLYTYVNPAAIRSTNPGFCFKAAGWRKCGVTRARGLHILEKCPPAGNTSVNAEPNSRYGNSHNGRPRRRPR